MEKKKMPLPKKKPRHASPKHPMNTEKTKPLGKQVGGTMEMLRQRSMPRPPPPSPKRMPRVSKDFIGSRPKKKFTQEQYDSVKKRSKRGTAKSTPSTGMAGGGKLKMVEKGGKKVPFFAADGVGKMAKGGDMTRAMKEKMFKDYGKAGIKKGENPRKSIEDLILEVGKEQGVFKKNKGGMMKKKMSYAKGGPVKVKSGDTLSQIAKSKGVTLKALMAANPSIRNANQIRVGQSIKVPTGGKSSSPYKGMTRSSMKALADDTAANRARLRGAKPSKARTAKSPDVAKKRATTTTRLNQLGEANKQRRAADAASKKSGIPKTASDFAGKPIKNPRTGKPMLTPKRAAAMTGSTKSVTSSENKRLDAIRKKARSRADRRMGGGSMKKVQGYKSGGLTVRGAGAATKGTGFNRAG